MLTNLNNPMTFFKYQLIVFGESGQNGTNARKHVVMERGSLLEGSN